MRRALALALVLGLAGAMVASAEGERKEGARGGMTDEQKKAALERQAKGWEAQLKATQDQMARAETELAQIADPEIKKEAEALLQKSKTLVAGLESALNAAKQNDFDEATRVGRDVAKTQGEVRDESRTLSVKIDIDRFGQLAQKAGDNAEAAAACQKVVDLLKKKLEVAAKADEINKQMAEMDREIAAAKRAAVVRPAAKHERPAGKERKGGEGKEKKGGEEKQE